MLCYVIMLCYAVLCYAVYVLVAVLKLILMLPPSRDGEAAVQSNVLFEELVRMKIAANPIVPLLSSGYGAHFVQAIISVRPQLFLTCSSFLM